MYSLPRLTFYLPHAVELKWLSSRRQCLWWSRHRSEWDLRHKCRRANMDVSARVYHEHLEIRLLLQILLQLQNVVVLGHGHVHTIKLLDLHGAGCRDHGGRWWIDHLTQCRHRCVVLIFLSTRLHRQDCTTCLRLVSPSTTPVAFACEN